MNNHLIKTCLSSTAILLTACSFVASDAKATISLTLDAGYLRPFTNLTTPANSDPNPINTSTGGGALLMLVETGSNLPTTVPAGSYLNPGETLIAAFGMNATGDGKTSGVTPAGDTRGAETFNGINGVAFPAKVGNGYVELRWFPSITLTQYTQGAVPAAGSHFGAYNPLLYPAVNGTNLATDGGSSWTVPTVDGSSDTVYNFFTSDDTGRGLDPAGSQAPAEGFANFTVVPELSTYGIVGGALMTLMSLRSWKRRSCSKA